MCFPRWEASLAELKKTLPSNLVFSPPPIACCREQTAQKKHMAVLLGAADEQERAGLGRLLVRPLLPSLPETDSSLPFLLSYIPIPRNPRSPVSGQPGRCIPSRNNGLRGNRRPLLHSASVPLACRSDSLRRESRTRSGRCGRSHGGRTAPCRSCHLRPGSRPRQTCRRGLSSSLGPPSPWSAGAGSGCSAPRSGEAASCAACLPLQRAPLPCHQPSALPLLGSGNAWRLPSHAESSPRRCVWHRLHEQACPVKHGGLHGVAGRALPSFPPSSCHAASALHPHRLRLHWRQKPCRCLSHPPPPLHPCPRRPTCW
mmetsp:Transcript_32706/g.92766  ORF Transcript_32706/g.92766 Transcript_32706/m.92766 type:complete len:314 (+) Transcript_32706:1079-2020(+)